MKSNAGRKPIGDKAMNDRLTIRLSGLEMQAIKITAEEHGYKDLSKFMRNLLVASAIVKHTLKQIRSESK
jgi:hypothetical protein